MQQILRLLPVAICALSITGLDALSSKVDAAEIRFTPKGSQLDGDTILDIKLNLNQPVVVQFGFDIFADITGYTPSNPDTAFIEFELDYFTDKNEYSGIPIGLPQPYDGRPVTGSRVVSLSGSPVKYLETFTGVIFKPGIEPDDGVVDFGITLTGINLFDNDGNLIGTEPASAFDAPSFNALGESGTEFNQVVEFQQVPEPLTILGSATALGVGALLKRKYSKN